MDKHKDDPWRPGWVPRNKWNQFLYDKLKLIGEGVEGIMATLDELKAKVAEISTRLDNIAADIQTIKDNLPPTGGLTAEEVTQLGNDLDAVITKATGLDEANPGTL